MKKKKMSFFYLSYDCHFSHTKTSILVDLRYIIFSYLCNLMKCSTSELTKNERFAYFNNKKIREKIGNKGGEDLYLTKCFIMKTKRRFFIK